jgi:hypothetical protein
MKAKYKKGEITKVECPNCKALMVIEPKYYWYHYKDDDMTDGSTTTWDENALECPDCSLTYAGGGSIDFMGYEINYWDKDYTLIDWLEDVKNGKGKNVIKYL